MLHITLGDQKAPPAHDPMGRSWVGYDKDVTDEELFAINRGTWKLGPRAARERHVLFSHDGHVKFVAEIHGLEKATNGRQIIVGRLLQPDEPLAKRWVDEPSPVANRNPIAYYQDPDHGPLTCACGCGAPVSASRAFLPGHDQRAIHSRIVKGWGDTLGFIDWFDANHEALGGGQ
jgi:hypothetical protein